MPRYPLNVYRHVNSAQIVPNAPASLTSVANTITQTSVELTFPASVVPAGGPAVTEYYIFRDGVHVRTVVQTNRTPIMSGLTPGTQYRWGVKAHSPEASGGGVSPMSPIYTMTTTASGGAPGAPTASAPTGISNTGMTIPFTPGASDPINATQGYRLYRQGSTTHLREVVSTSRSFVLTGLTSGTRYDWFVRAFNSVNGVITESENSNVVGASTTGSIVVLPIRQLYGISTHTNYRSSPQYGNDALTRQLTLAAKPLWLRDLLATGAYDQDALWRTYTNAGILGWHATVGAYSLANNKLELQARMIESADILEEVTGMNEPDGHTNIEIWLPKMVEWQKWLWNFIKGNSSTSHIKVGLGALRGANPNGLNEMKRYIDATIGYFEFVDLHCYPGPKTEAEIKAVIDGRIKWAHGHPYQFSEYGGSTANMTLAKQAEVCTVGLQYLASKGVKTFIYELWDDPDTTGADLQSNFGIYESNGNDKPAVVALRSLVT